MVFFDYVCGVRLHVAYISLVGVFDDFSFGLLDYVFYILSSCFFVLDLFDFGIVNSRFVYLRFRGLSFVDLLDVFCMSISGVLLRSVGLLWDVRLWCCYELYGLLFFDFSLGIVGDVLDRFILRLFDIRNSFLICRQLFFGFFFGFLVCLFDLYVVDLLIETYIYMFYMLWCLCFPGVSLSLLESPKGDYLLVISLFYCVCSRARIRCADYLHLLLLDVLCRGFLFSDLVLCLGNLDVVFGSVDR